MKHQEHENMTRQGREQRDENIGHSEGSKKGAQQNKRNNERNNNRTRHTHQGKKKREYKEHTNRTQTGHKEDNITINVDCKETEKTEGTGEKDRDRQNKQDRVRQIKRVGVSRKTQQDEKKNSRDLI